MGRFRGQERRPTQRQRDDARLAAQIAAAHTRSRQNYGAPRLVEELREEGTPISKRRCSRLMKARGLQGRKKHRRRPRTTDSRHAHPPAENLLAKTKAPTGPNQAWVTDITYIETAEGWLYLAALLDVWSRRIVGWACGPTLHVSLVLAALQAAEGELDLALPQTPLFAKQIDWNVQLPATYDLSVTGNVDSITDKTTPPGLHLCKSLCRDQQPQARITYRKRTSN